MVAIDDDFVAFQVSINDVVLAACSGALRRFLIEHGTGMDGRVLKANCVIPTTQNHANIQYDFEKLVPQYMEEGEDALRQKRAAEREKMAAERGAGDEAKVIPMTAAAEQKTEAEKILDKLNWVHRRIALY